MTQYIELDALVAEIERRIEALHSTLNERETAVKFELKDLLSFIGTLEVKDVDFEKELDRIWFDNKLGDYFNNDALDFALIRTLCRHFFELGIKAQNGSTLKLTWQDIKKIATIGNDFLNSKESDGLNEEQYYTEILKRYLFKIY